MYRNDTFTSECRWRSNNVSDVNHPMTSRYETCSPSLSHCPDHHCDALEQLDQRICPQDCTIECKFYDQNKITWKLWVLDVFWINYELDDVFISQPKLSSLKWTREDVELAVRLRCALAVICRSVHAARSRFSGRKKAERSLGPENWKTTMRYQARKKVGWYNFSVKIERSHILR